MKSACRVGWVGGGIPRWAAAARVSPGCSHGRGRAAALLWKSPYGSSNKEKSISTSSFPILTRSFSSVPVPSAVPSSAEPSTGHEHEHEHEHHPHHERKDRRRRRSNKSTNGSGDNFRAGSSKEFIQRDSTVGGAAAAVSRRPSRDLVQSFNRDHNFTGMEITFLGTGAGSPTGERSPSCTALRCPLKTYLFDVGEGSLRQLQQSHIRVVSVQDIFITHLHGDHIFGLPSIIMGINYTIKTDPLVVGEKGGNSSSAEKEVGGRKLPVVTIYGPVGLGKFIHSSLAISGGALQSIKVVVVELVTPRSQRRGDLKMPTRGGPYLRVERVMPDEDGTYNIYSRKGNHTCPSISVRARTIKHKNVDCFGYVVEESSDLLKIDAEKAIAMGLPPSRAYQLLQRGQSVTLDDGRVISPDDVCEPPRGARKVAILGDTNDASNILNLAKNADVIVHEATGASDLGDSLISERGHSSSMMAGRFAKAANAHWLLLNHISARYTNVPPDWMTKGPMSNFKGGRRGRSRLMKLAKEASTGFGSSKIQVARDFMTFRIPSGGFSVPDNAASSAETLVTYLGSGGVETLGQIDESE